MSKNSEKKFEYGIALFKETSGRVVLQEISSENIVRAASIEEIRELCRQVEEDLKFEKLALILMAHLKNSRIQIVKPKIDVVRNRGKFKV